MPPEPSIHTILLALLDDDLGDLNPAAGLRCACGNQDDLVIDTVLAATAGVVLCLACGAVADPPLGYGGAG